ncbi:NAD(P)-binding protein [Meredithblackwellia eburnea MCA 4105]
MKIEGRAFVVTGGLGSIGGATAKAIVEKGGYAVLFDMLPVEKAQQKISTFEQPGKYLYQRADISSKESTQDALAKVLKDLPPNVLIFGGVHCAAVNPSIPWPTKLSDKLDDFATVLKINAYGTFCLDACLADAINSQYPPRGPFDERVEEERGAIVNIASVVGSHTPARCVTYGPSKTCVLGITNAVADFLAPSGIRVNSISPALVVSALMDAGLRMQYFKEELQAQAMFPRRFTEPAEIAQAILFLLENSMMNAFELKVDAGWRQISCYGGGQDPRKRSPIVE